MIQELLKMASAHRSINLIFPVLVAMLYASLIFLQTANAKALSREARYPSTDNSAPAATNTDPHGFPVNVKVEDESTLPKNSCFIVNTTEFGVQRVIVMDGEEMTIEETAPVTARQCCEGYTGLECNQKVSDPPKKVPDPYELSNPCRGKTCPNHENATCQIVTVCGEDVPVFLDVFGKILDCGNEVEQEDSTSIGSLQCNGICDSNPCAGQTCEMYPDEAVCLVVGCDCEPVWFLANGVSVDCSSGNPIDQVGRLSKRRKRQTDGMTSETSTCR